MFDDVDGFFLVPSYFTDDACMYMHQFLSQHIIIYMYAKIEKMQFMLRIRDKTNF